MPHGRTRKQTNGIAVWAPLNASSVVTFTLMGSTLLRRDGDDPEQQEAVQMKQATH